jgi:hypothetical protein
MASEALNSALELIRKNIEKAQASIQGLKRSANVLAAAEGESIVYTDADDPIVSAGSSGTIRADLFTQYSTPSTAVRAYLEHRGKTQGAATVDEIFEALKRGGYEFENNDVEAKSGLRIALGKDSQVKRLANGSYGLVVWYGDRFAKKDKAAAEPASTVTQVPPPSAASVVKEGERVKL